MMNRQQKRKHQKDVERIQNMVIKRLDAIVSTAKKIAFKWDLQTIPFNTWDEIIEKSKVNPNTSNESVNQINQAFNNTLDTLSKTLKNSSLNMSTNNIPVKSIENGVLVIKNAYLDSFNG